MEAQSAKSDNCPDLDLLSKFAIGNLANDSITDEIATHVESCRTCVNLLRELDSNSPSNSLINGLQRGAARAGNHAPGKLDAGLDHALHRVLNIGSSKSTSQSQSNKLDRNTLPEISDYRITREIGRGGMGIVYEAEQISLSRRVALKTMRMGIQSSDVHSQRFQHEARTAAKLHHSNIVPVYDVGEENDTFYYAMQFVDGRSLDRVIAEARKLFSDRREQPAQSVARQLAQSMAGARTLADDMTQANDGFHQRVTDVVTEDFGRDAIASNSSADTGSRFSSQETLPQALADQSTSPGNNRFRTYCRAVAHVGFQVADALNCAHTHGVIHRDIKPANLLMDFKGKIWVADFGLVKTENTELTQTGDFVGTLRYMSPERFDSLCDARSDIYSLGLTLYEMLALRPAFESSGQLSLLEKIRSAEPKGLRQINPRVPFDLQTIISKAIEKEPKRRYQTAEALADDLNRFLDGRPIRARRVTAFEQMVSWCRRNPAIAALAASLVVLLAVGLLVSTYSAFRFREMAIEQTRLTGEANTSALKATKSAEKAESEARKSERLLYCNDMRVAAESVRLAGGYRAARRLLEKWKDNERDLRGWEWYWLRAATTRELTVYEGDDTYGVSIRPDGETMAFSRGSSIHIVDLKIKNLRFKLGPVMGKIKFIEFNREGSMIAATSRDPNRIYLFDVNSKKIVYQSENLKNELGPAHWTPNDQEVLVASGGPT